MHRAIVISLILLAGQSCSRADNPIVAEWETPFAMPPFADMPHDRFVEAYEIAAEMQNDALRELLDSKDEPTFENTIEPYERSRSTLYRVLRAFIPMSGTISDDALKAASKEIFPAFAAHEEAIFLNRDIFERVDTIYQSRFDRELDPDQVRLVELIHLEFVKYGVGVDEDKKPRLEVVSGRLAELEQEFIANNRAESNAFEILVEDKDKLGDMPSSTVDAARERAKEKGHDCECYSFSLVRSMVTPFLEYVTDRSLREALYKAYFSLGTNDNEWNTVEIVNEVLELRAERAQLLGFKNFAEFKTAYGMAETPANVEALLDEVWKAAKIKAEEDRELIEKALRDDGVDDRVRAWDWAYYANNVRKSEFNISDEEVRQYLPLDQVRSGAFDMANRLFDVSFRERPDLPRWHPDQEVHEVLNKDGEHLGILILDWYARDNKRIGIWTDEIRVPEAMDARITGIASNTYNFAKGSNGAPALLSEQEGSAVFHELGHAMHTILSTQRYVRLSGFNYWPRDAVEFPPQALEYWFFDTDFMRTFARHYETGEPIPSELVERMVDAGQFNRGHPALSQTASSYLDLAMHSVAAGDDVDVLELQEALLAKIDVPEYVGARYLAPFFAHSISGGYEASFYGYLWSDVMAADAFGAFRETSLFDEQTAARFREYIFESGASEPQLELFEKFRGRSPSSSALISEMGLN